jgi:hypothetical protein
MFNLSGAGQWAASRVVFNHISDLAFAPKLGLAVGLDGTVLRTH